MARSIGRVILEHRIQSERDRLQSLEKNRNRVLEMVAENESIAAILVEVVPSGGGAVSGSAVFSADRSRMKCWRGPPRPVSRRMPSGCSNRFACCRTRRASIGRA